MPYMKEEFKEIKHNGQSKTENNNKYNQKSFSTKYASKARWIQHECKKSHYISSNP